MRSAESFRDGLRRVWNAPTLVAGALLATLFVAVPLSLALDGMLSAHLGRSLMGEASIRAPDYEWWQEFLGQANGLGATFVPSILGFGAVLQDISNLIDNVPLATVVAGVTAVWLVIWSFLSGGMIDRLARERATRARGFFGASGAHFPAIARLGGVAFVLYWVLFSLIHPVFLGELFGRIVRDMTAERNAFATRVVFYSVFGLLLLAVNTVLDYARIRIVVEDRRSALAALLAASRFVRRNLGSVCAVYGLNAAAFLLVIAVYALVAPRASAPGWLILVVGELYVLTRLFLKLTFYGSQTALFQRALAHAAYTAAPPIVWPESPSAERIINAGMTS
jgi:hypothetical protein